MTTTLDLRIVPAVAALLLLTTVAACGAATGAPDAAGPGAPSASASSASQSSSGVRLVGEDEANLQLWVSNQSFVDDPVSIEIRIDGTPVVSQPFAVEGQHNWVLFTIAAPPGPHEVSMVAGNGTDLVKRFVLPEHGRRYAVVNYWNYPDDGGRHFEWTIQSKPVAFA